MGVQAAQLALFEALRREQQVDAERAAQPADHHEQVDEVRLRREQLAELVDDDEQRGHRLERRTLFTRALVVLER